MFKTIFSDFIHYATIFNVFQYISFRAAYAAVTSLMISIGFGAFFIRKLREFKFGQTIRSEGPSTHLKKKGTPTMGGVLIVVSMVISTLLWQDFKNSYTWILLFSVVGFGALGFADDYLKITLRNSKGLVARQKFLGQVSLSFVLMLLIFFFGDKTQVSLLYVPFLKDAALDISWFFIPLGMIVLVGTSNAVNLTDGLDGLATGLALIAFIPFVFIAYITGRVDFSMYLHFPYIAGMGEISIPIMAMIGACIGFLWFNCHPAQIMMGDTGSLAIGGVLAVVALMVKQEILLCFIGGMFVLETLSVIIQVLVYKGTRGEKRFFKMAPLHHHFELSGWDESKVVTRFWILGGLFAIVGLSTLKLR